jgi:putative hydrolase
MIYGDYHVHTNQSDGKETTEDIIRAAALMGLKEIAVTDHGHGKWVGGLHPKNYQRAKSLIAKAAEENNIRALFGIEANITGTRGQIDVSPKDLNELDILICGIHRMVRPASVGALFSFFLPNYFWSLIRWTPKTRIAKNTTAIINVLEKNDIDILAHPSRYFRADVVKIAEVAAKRGTLMELNGSRISFRPIDFERMLEKGAKFIINSDAHTSRRVGSIDRVTEFLKTVDYRESDIINLNEPFVRTGGGQYQAVAEKKAEPAVNTKSKKK